MRANLFLLMLAITEVAHAEPPSEETAKELYAKGKLAYAQARYPEALTYFERAYALSQAPALLFNMAQAERLSGPEHCERALHLYRSYVAALPDADNRHEADERIQEMQACVTRQSRTQSNVPPREPARAPQAHTLAPAPRSDQSTTAPILVTGIGAALAVAGGVLYAGALHNYRQAEDECPCYPGSYSTWETATYVSYGLLVTGGLTVATGVTWWLSLNATDSSEAPRSAALGIRSAF